MVKNKGIAIKGIKIEETKTYKALLEKCEEAFHCACDSAWDITVYATPYGTDSFIQSKLPSANDIPICVYHGEYSTVYSFCIGDRWGNYYILDDWYENDIRQLVNDFIDFIFDKIDECLDSEDLVQFLSYKIGIHFEPEDLLFGSYDKMREIYEKLKEKYPDEYDEFYKHTMDEVKDYFLYECGERRRMEECVLSFLTDNIIR